MADKVPLDLYTDSRNLYDDEHFFKRESEVENRCSQVARKFEGGGVGKVHPDQRTGNSSRLFNQERSIVRKVKETFAQRKTLKK